MHKYELVLLRLLAKKGVPLRPAEILEVSGINRDSLFWAVENLRSKGYIDVHRSIEKYATITEEGKKYAESKLPELQLLDKLAANGPIEISSMRSSEDQISLKWAKEKGFIAFQNGKMVLTDKGANAQKSGIEEDIVLKELYKNPEKISDFEAKYASSVSQLEKRKLIIIGSKNGISSVEITPKGLRAAEEEQEDEEAINTIDRRIIASRAWEGKKFKPYDISLDVEKQYIAKQNPLREAINRIKEIYLSSGYMEATGPIVLPAFWTFDSLFVPQDHPARDMQDTFYLSNPSSISVDNPRLLKKVKKAQEEAWHIGWSKEIAEQAVLRTQTTSVSIAKLYSAEVLKYNMPIKMFSVGRVFRNENIDPEHLADFYQTDGIVIGRKLTLANLFDSILRIYKPLGVKIRFKPSYFPFVEPGVEVQVYYEPKKKWLELGGAGIIRKEITDIVSSEIKVLAWGLGVERILLAKDPGIKGIYELYNNGIGWLRNKKAVIL